MATLRQTSFAAGELSPLLWGRSDLETHAHGARRLRNFVVTPQGAAATRPGTLRVGTAKTLDVILVSFVVSDELSYVLELGDGYFRVHDPETGYTGIERATPFQAKHLHELQFAQVGTVMTVAHASYAPQEIVNPFSGAWLCRAARFAPPGDTSDTPMEAYFVEQGNKAASVPHVTPLSNVSGSLVDLFVADAANPPREWRWKVSSIVQNISSGEVFETLPRAIVEFSNGYLPTTRAPLPDDGLVVLSKERPIRLRNPSFAAHIPKPTNYEVIGLVWYRGRGNLYGYIGTTRWAQDFVDVGDEPNYARQPLRGDGLSGRPTSVTFFQQRRVFAGGSRLWASATDNWANHDRPFPPFFTADQPIEASILGSRRQSIRSLVTHARLLTFSDVGVWSAEYQPGAENTPSFFGFRLEDEVGATKLQPLVVDGAVLYVKAKGRGVRALQLDSNGGTQYVGRDITAHAEHLFRDPLSEIVSWTFQRDPWATIWAVRADGDFLTCTRTGPTTWAWTKHHSTGGFVRSVASVPIARADVTLAAVTRNGVTYIERFLLRDRATTIPIIVTDANPPGEDGFPVDCGTGFTVDVRQPKSCTGLERFEGQDVWAVAPGNAPQGPFRVAGGAITTEPFDLSNREDGKVYFIVGAAFVCELQTLDAGGLQQKTVTKVGFEVDQSQGLEAGQDFEHLAPWRQREPSDSYEFPGAASELVVVAVKGAWRRHGRAVLRQAQPLPVTVLGVSREVEAGGS